MSLLEVRQVAQVFGHRLNAGEEGMGTSSRRTRLKARR